jgi:hypothetical protein
MPRLAGRGVSVLDFVAGTLKAPTVVSAALSLLAAPAWAQSSHRHHSTPPASSSPSPSPSQTLTLTFNPQMPSVQATVPLGTVIATVTAAWSDGSPFTGTLMFGSPYADDGGTFALSVRCPHQRVDHRRLVRVQSRNGKATIWPMAGSTAPVVACAEMNAAERACPR